MYKKLHRNPDSSDIATLKRLINVQKNAIELIEKLLDRDLQDFYPDNNEVKLLLSAYNEGGKFIISLIQIYNLQLRNIILLSTDRDKGIANLREGIKNELTEYKKYKELTDKIPSEIIKTLINFMVNIERSSSKDIAKETLIILIMSLVIYSIVDPKLATVKIDLLFTEIPGIFILPIYPLLADKLKRIVKTYSKTKQYFTH